MIWNWLHDLFSVACLCDTFHQISQLNQSPRHILGGVFTYSPARSVLLCIFSDTRQRASAARWAWLEKRGVAKNASLRQRSSMTSCATGRVMVSPPDSYERLHRVRHLFEIVFHFAGIVSRLQSDVSLLVAADSEPTEINSSEQCMQRVSCSLIMFLN